MQSNTDKNQQTVVVIDDDPSVRNGLTRLIKVIGYQVIELSSAQEFLDAPPLEQPGCIVLDLEMPNMSGLELQKKLTERNYHLPIIFLTAHGDISSTRHAMKNGAVDFLTKPVDRDELLNAIEESIAGDVEIRGRRGERYVARSRLKELTPREFEVMTHVVTGKLNKQIAADLDISQDTVKIHRGRVMRKLEVESVPQLINLTEIAGVRTAETS